MTVAVMLGGIALDKHAGAPEQAEQPIGGSRVLRMSDGAAVKQTHWQKTSGTLAGRGVYPAGLDGLDYSNPLELRVTQVMSMQSAGLVFVLPSTPRPDRAPWSLARVDGQWRRTPCALNAETNTVTVTAVAGADQYRVDWMPVYSVMAERPARSQNGSFDWSVPWEEV